MEKKTGILSCFLGIIFKILFLSKTLSGIESHLLELRARKDEYSILWYQNLKKIIFDK